MSRDYKPATPKEKPTSKGNPFITGLLVGLLLGVGISVGVVIAINGSANPFTDNVTPGAKIEANQTSDAAIEKDNSALPKGENHNSGVTEDEKPRFDFYTILPGSESQITEQEIKLKEAETESQASAESYFLQVGAFQNEADADNQKAKLALLGIEAIVQTAEIPEKGIWHRVRVGPFADLDQINKARSQLTVNGFSSDLIKVSSKSDVQ